MTARDIAGQDGINPCAQSSVSDGGETSSAYETLAAMPWLRHLAYETSMNRNAPIVPGTWLFVLAVLFASTTGCHLLAPAQDEISAESLAAMQNSPKELHKAILPDYVIEPPDVLVVDAFQVVPKSPYQVRTLDSLMIQVVGTLPDEPIAGIHLVALGGSVNLGISYGAVKVTGLTVEDAQLAIEKHLTKYLKDAEVSVTLADIAARQQITGQSIVGPDGKITLGTYGSVSVVGKTIAEAKLAIEKHLSQFLEDPQISVNVFAYNSKVYYVITQGAGLGDGLYRFPSTGNETVLDALAQINGLDQTSSKKIWIARPGRNSMGGDQILPVDWLGITQRGDIQTNFQVLPGDRVYVAEDKWIAFDTSLAKFTAPFERIFGFTLLGAGAVTRLSGHVLRGGGDQRSGF
jgi:polysaccharide export outer membrane protein